MTSANTGGTLISKIGSYLQIVTNDPSSTAFVPLAEAYRQVGLLDDALEAARLGTGMLPHFSPGFSTMGRILGQMGRIDEAMSSYAKALSIDRQSQSALVGLARLHLIRSERDQARRILLQAQEFHPDDGKIADMLNALDLPRPWDEIKQAPVVQESVAQDTTLDDESAEPIPTATLAEIYVKQGLTDKALKVYNDILEQNPENDSVRQRISELQSSLQPDQQMAGEQEPAVDMSQQEPVASQPVAEKTRDRSPLAVMQRWLDVIRQGRANVS